MSMYSNINRAISEKKNRNAYWNRGIFWCKGPYWNEGAYSTGMFVRIGALVSKNFF